MKTYWLSFANPGVDGNLGCCIIDAEDEEGALNKVDLLGINPGGEILFILMPDVPEAQEEVEKWGKNRLISVVELEVDGYDSLSDLTDDQKEFMDNDPNVTKICEDCNIRDVN